MKKNLKLAVTGAGGFLGTSVVEALAKMPHITELRLLYTHPPTTPPLDAKIRPFFGDLKDRNLAKDLIHGTDTVVHLANRGIPADPAIDTPTFLQENLSVTGALLEAMVIERVPKIIYASSGGAIYRYDPLRKVPFHEGSEIEFRSPFALAKYSTENLLHYYKRAYSISPVILRFANPFGKHQVGDLRHGFIGIVFYKILKGEEIRIFGNLDIVKDFIYIDDVVRVLDGFLQRPEHQGVFNVGSGMGVSLREVITNVERLTHKKAKLSFASFNPSDSPWTVLNTSKLQKTLSWTCRHSLQDGIRLLWEQIKEQNPPVEVPLKKAS